MKSLHAFAAALVALPLSRPALAQYRPTTGAICVSGLDYEPQGMDARGSPRRRMRRGEYLIRVDDGALIDVRSNVGTLVVGLSTERAHTVVLFIRRRRVASMRVHLTTDTVFDVMPDDYDGPQLRTSLYGRPGVHPCRPLRRGSPGPQNDRSPQSRLTVTNGTGFPSREESHGGSR